MATSRSASSCPRPMTESLSHPIAAKWPATHPDRLQLYSLPTPNGVKVSIMPSCFAPCNASAIRQPRKLETPQ